MEEGTEVMRIRSKASVRCKAKDRTRASSEMGLLTQFRLDAPLWAWWASAFGLSPSAPGNGLGQSIPSRFFAAAFGGEGQLVNQSRVPEIHLKFNFATAFGGEGESQFEGQSSRPCDLSLLGAWLRRPDG